MIATMHGVAAITGGILLLIALAAFFRSFWRRLPKRERDEYSPDGMPGGPGSDGYGSSGHADGGGGHAGH